MTRSASASRTIAIVVLLMVTACGKNVEKKTGTEFLTSDEFAELGLPFSEAVRVGDMLYLSGQIGNLPGTLELVPGGVQAETRQTMDNIRRVLENSGSGLDRVVKCTVYLADIAEWTAVNEVYRTYFEPPYPARSAMAGSGLALGARVEIECFATVD